MITGLLENWKEAKVDRLRLIKLLAIAFGISVAVTSGWLWFSSSPAVSDRTSYRTVAVVPTGISTSAAILLPDRGEARLVRQAHIDAVIEALRRDSQMSPAFADALLARARVCHDLEKQAAAQQAVDEVRQLVPSTTDWRHREAQLITDILRDWEESDAREKQHLRDAREQRIEALSLHAAGDYLAAVAAARQVVSVSRRRFWELTETSFPLGRQLQLAEDLFLLGRLMREHGDTYLEAHGRLDEAFTLSVELRGEMHPGTAEMLRALAVVEDDRGEFEAANAKYDRALEIFRETQGELSLEFARTLAQQGRMHLEWWEDYAWGKCFRALQIREQLLGQVHLECAESLEDLGFNAYELFQLEKAESLLNAALSIREREQGVDHPETARAKNWLSQCAAVQGDTARADVMQRRAIGVIEKYRGKTHPHLIRSLTNFARLSARNWNESRGHRACRRALEIAAQYGLTSHPSSLEALTVQGELVLYEEETFRFGNVFGFGHLRELDLHEGFVTLRDAIDAHERLPRAAQLPTYPLALLMCGHLGYYNTYEYMDRERSRQLIERARHNLNQYGADLHPIYSDYLWTSGRWHLWNGEYEQAMSAFEANVRLNDERFGVLPCEQREAALAGLAGCYLHQRSNPEHFEKLFRKILPLSDQMFLRSAPGQSEIDRFCIARKRFYTCGMILNFSPPGTDLGSYYPDLLRIRGATAAIQAGNRLATEHSETKPFIEHVEAARRRLRSLVFDSPESGEGLETWHHDLTLASDEKEDRERELAFATRHLLPPFEALELAKLQQAIPAEGVFIDFLQFEAYYSPPGHRGRLAQDLQLAAFVIRRDSPPQFVLLGPSSRIQQAISDWRNQLNLAERVDAGRDLHQAARDVADQVWKPLEPFLKDVRTALIAPDGPLCFLSFATLPSSTPGRFLLEDYTFGYVPSARQLVEGPDSPRDKSVGGLLTIGNIDYESQTTGEQELPTGNRSPLPANASWSNLPGSLMEIERVEDLHRLVAPGEPRVQLTETAATTHAFRSALARKWRYVHFAGHGFFTDRKVGRLEETSLDSPEVVRLVATRELLALGRSPLLLAGLAFASPSEKTTSDNLIMTAEEVSGLDLRGTELVTLSACETGLGKTPLGEGMLGLQSVLLTSGARSTLTSLWKVDDEGTSLLMERFYRYLWIEGLPKWEALRRAQLDVLNNPKLISQQSDLLVSRGLKTGQTKPVAVPKNPDSASELRTSPFYWGAFVLYGDGR